MNYLDATLGPISSLIRPHLTVVGMALASVLLAIFAVPIRKHVRKSTKALPFVGRLSVFILLAAFGYGALTVMLGQFAAHLLARLDGVWLAPVVTAAFLGLGVLAEREGHL